VRVVELMLARALLYQGRNAESEQVIRQMLAVSPDQPEALAALAVVLYYRGRLDEAATLATRVSAGGSQEKSPSCFAGLVYAARGERRKVDPQVLRLRPGEVIIPELAYRTREPALPMVPARQELCDAADSSRLSAVLGPSSNAVGGEPAPVRGRRWWRGGGVHLQLRHTCGVRIARWSPLNFPGVDGILEEER